ncbi:MAG: sugar phosphate isomerase/epimerase [Candidatus Bathyarchaeota archaeon]|nr:MAG: sugar phosphate isomerase/epimerase [Candidatus Bathyarchaeota archaeon]
MKGIAVGMSMLHCLNQPFSSLLRRLETLERTDVELIDDGWHTLDRDRIRQLLEIGRSRRLRFSVHAPFISLNIASPVDAMRDFFLKRLQKSIKAARLLECTLMVIHPGMRTGLSPLFPGLDWQTNLESTRKVLSAAEDCGVKITVENCPSKYGFLLSSVEEFRRFFDELGEDVDLAFDVGHSNLNEQTLALIEAFGEKIVHIHAHDNDGVDDTHAAVGCGSLDWKLLAENVKNVGFKGTMIVESYSGIEESMRTLRSVFS